MTAPRTAAITNLGCKVNQAEMDAVVRRLREGGVRLVDDREAADLYIVNTCTVTSIADQKSRQAVRRARRANPAATVIVTGCSVQVGPDTIAAADPQAQLVDNSSKDAFLAELGALLGLPEGGPMPTLSGVEAAGAGPAARFPGVSDDRTRIDRTRAFVKVQDGCAFHCTYCIIPRARGAERSLDPDRVLADVRSAIRAGHREVVLTGINVGTYDGGESEAGPRGSHAWEALSLPGLIRRVLAETELERLRLSSIEPQHVSGELLETWTSPMARGRCMPHFHLPLQSGDDGVLRRMGRRYDSGTYATIVARVREAIPGVAIHADVIAGFPTEDDAAFGRTLTFLQALEPAGLHVFRYSSRPGTPATRMLGQVDEPTRRQRAARLLAFADDARAAYARQLVGRRLDVLFETPLSDGRWVGRAGEYLEVAVAASEVGPMENVRAVVEATGIDREAPDRLNGDLLEARAAPRAGRPLPVVADIPSFGPTLARQDPDHGNPDARDLDRRDPDRRATGETDHRPTEGADHAA